MSVEVPEDDKPEVIASVRKNPLTLDSYIVPVVFDKSAQARELKEEGKNTWQGLRQAAWFVLAL